MCWKGKKTNYQEIADFVNLHGNSKKVKEFEKKLEDISLIDYKVYISRFKEKKTFIMISKELKISTARITESLNAVELAVQIYFGI